MDKIFASDTLNYRVEVVLRLLEEEVSAVKDTEIGDLWCHVRVPD